LFIVWTLFVKLTMESLANRIPDEFKALRACLRCGLIKTFIQVCSFVKIICDDDDDFLLLQFCSLMKQDVITVNFWRWKEIEKELMKYVVSSRKFFRSNLIFLRSSVRHRILEEWLP
jgi:hypothetical protein